MTEDVTELPHLRELFAHLRRGKHLCVADGPLYIALRANYAAYRRLFDALGFNLVEHSKGIYYFQADADLGKDATQLAVFFFVLVEAWGDAGRDLETAAFDPAGHHIDELPHLSREGWRNCLAEAEVTDASALAEVVSKLERYGFTERIDEGRFRFRTPVWRFFDLCLDVFQESLPDEEVQPKDMT